MLKQMRKGAHGIFAKLLILALIASFAVWGIGDMVTGAPSNAVATVGEVTITAQRYDRALERVRRSFGSHYTSELFNQLGVPEQVLNALINNALLVQEADKIGLSFSDETLAERIRNNPDFSNNSGEFDRQLFSLVLRDNRLNEQTYLQILREELNIGLLEGLVGNTPIAHAFSVDMLYNATHEKRDATIALVEDRHITIPNTPEAGALEEMYAARKELYQTPEYRSFSYVELDLQAKASELKPTSADIVAYYENNEAEFTTNEQRSVVQWLFANKEDAEKALESRAVEMTNSPAEAKVENGSYSDLGTVSRNTLLEQAEGDVFSARVGQLTSPIETGFGWHIFMVRDIQPSRVTPFEDVKAAIEVKLSETKKSNALTELTTELEDLVASGASIEEVAAEHDVTVNHFGPISQNGIHKERKEVTKNAIQERILEKHFFSEEGELSDVFLNDNNQYYILRVDEVSVPTTMPFETVKSDLLKEWKSLESRTKKLNRATEAMNALIESNGKMPSLNGLKLRKVNARSIERNQQSIKLTNGKTLNTTNAFVLSLFSNNLLVPTKPFPLPNGSYAVGFVTNVTPAKPLSEVGASSSETVTRELKQQYKLELVDYYLRYLRQQYKVSLNETLYREVANR